MLSSDSGCLHKMIQDAFVSTVAAGSLPNKFSREHFRLGKAQYIMTFFPFSFSCVNTDTRHKSGERH